MIGIDSRGQIVTDKEESASRGVVEKVAEGWEAS
jgi:hypothetical protein